MGCSDGVSLFWQISGVYYSWNSQFSILETRKRKTHLIVAFVTYHLATMTTIQTVYSSEYDGHRPSRIAASNGVAGNPTTRPSPLEIVTSEPACNVHRLTNDVEAGDGVGFHCL